jgi:hypothetical protein
VTTWKGSLGSQGGNLKCCILSKEPKPKLEIESWILWSWTFGRAFLGVSVNSGVFSRVSSWLTGWVMVWYGIGLKKYGMVWY